MLNSERTSKALVAADMFRVCFDFDSGSLFVQFSFLYLFVFML